MVNLTHDTFIVINLTSVLGVLLIAVHSLPLHYRPKQSLNPLSQRPLTKQAGKACHKQALATARYRRDGTT
jgi:hypothetical protein